MQTNLRRTRIPGWFEYYRETCPICHKSGGCMINEDGNTVACIRTESEIQFSKKFESWIHHLSPVDKQNFKKEKLTVVEGNKKANESHLSKIYNEMIDILTLNHDHYRHLSGEKRKMSNKEIYARRYVSFPEKPWVMVKQLAKKITTNDLVGVPGFYENDYGWTFAGNQGILIPYRNVKNEIVGLQYRVDNPKNDVSINKSGIKGLYARVIKQPNLVQIIIDGEIIEEVELEKNKTYAVHHGSELGFVTLKDGKRYFWISSANKKNGTGVGDPLPIHVAVPSKDLLKWESGTLHQADTVWITEGALKADLAAEHINKVYSGDEIDTIGSTFISVPGVNTWRMIFPVLQQMKVKTVNIAFDMDALSNSKVALAIKNMAKELRSNGYKGNLVIWNEDDGKGIDDIFVNGRFPQIRKIF